MGAGPQTGVDMVLLSPSFPAQPAAFGLWSRHERPCWPDPAPFALPSAKPGV